MESLKERMQNREKLEAWKKTQPEWVQEIWAIDVKEYNAKLKGDKVDK